MNCSEHSPESCGALHSPCGEHHTQRNYFSTNTPKQASQPTPTHSSALLLRLPHTSPFSPDLMRVTHAHPLHPAAQAFVPFGIVLVRVRVRPPVEIPPEPPPALRRSEHRPPLPVTPSDGPTPDGKRSQKELAQGAKDHGWHWWRCQWQAENPKRGESEVSYARYCVALS